MYVRVSSRGGVPLSAATTFLVLSLSLASVSCALVYSVCVLCSAPRYTLIFKSDDCMIHGILNFEPTHNDEHGTHF